MPVEVQITFDDPKFQEAVKNLDGITPHFADAMKNIMAVFMDKASEYAPESEANAPGRIDKNGKPMGFYERGRGWWYPLVTHNTLGLGGEIPLLRPHLKSPKTLKAGALMAQGFSGVAGYRLVPNSEQMDKQWLTDVTQNANEIVGELTNTASYSGYVQGVEQIVLHKEREWRQTTPTVWESEEVQNVVRDEIFAAIDQFYGLS